MQKGFGMQSHHEYYGAMKRRYIQEQHMDVFEVPQECNGASLGEGNQLNCGSRVRRSGRRTGRVEAAALFTISQSYIFGSISV
jgi:hypothetical protein